jgi:predicted amidohydrolase YtcJ
VHDDQVARTVELGIVASSQPNFVGEWSSKGGMYEARLGERYRVNNRFQDFLAAGIALAFGSDGMPFGPLVGLQSAVQHPDPSQRMPARQAVWHYTTAAAWSLHWEDTVGSLRPGMKADLLVLGQTDLDQAPSTWIIEEAIVGGLPAKLGSKGSKS